MVKGKPWSVEDEKRLKDWVTLGVSVDAMVFSFDGQYTKDAILRKMGRLGLEVVALEKKNGAATPSFELPEELPSIEETLMTLVAALELLKTSGLDKSEVLLKNPQPRLKKEVTSSKHMPYGVTTDYVKHVEAADSEKLAKLIKTVALLLQTKVYLFWIKGTKTR